MVTGGLITAWSAYGPVMCIVACVALEGVMVVFALDNDIAERNPRWLGGPSDGFGPPSIMDPQIQQIVEQNADKQSASADGSE